MKNNMGDNPYEDRGIGGYVRIDVRFNAKAEETYAVYLPVPENDEECQSIYSGTEGALKALGTRTLWYGGDKKAKARMFDPLTGEIIPEGWVYVQSNIGEFASFRPERAKSELQELKELAREYGMTSSQLIQVLKDRKIKL